MESVASLLKPLTDRLWNALFHWWDDVEGRKLCIDALQRIGNEKRNFEQLAAKREYNSAAHEKAVTQDSFELVDNAMNKLSQLSLIRYWRIRCIAANVSRLCKQELSRPAEQREATGILTVINQLVRRLERRTRGMSVEEKGGVRF